MSIAQSQENQALVVDLAAIEDGAMPTPPKQPKIYHITHVDNLPAIIKKGGLVSDAAMIRKGGPAATVGMAEIKQRRLRLPVDCHEDDYVGDYVPFYFCSRSIMLYLLHMGNHPGLTYRGGQGPIVHLEADLEKAVAWAEEQDQKWAFSLSNAGAVYTQFRDKLADLKDINWSAVTSRDFRAADVKEGKQAEFLMHEMFPWTLVERIGVHSMAVGRTVTTCIASAKHRPKVEHMPDWYF